MAIDARGHTGQGADRWLTPLVGVVAIAALVLALVGVLLDGASGADPDLAGTGPIKVSLTEFEITPASITVTPGAPLKFEVTNDGTMVHDFKVDGTTGTKRLQPGETQTIEVAPIDASTQAWCTLPGHKQSGMVMDIQVSGSGGDGHGTHDGTAGPGIDLSGKPSAGWTPRDPVLQPAPAGTLHKVTLHATEQVLEVAPGVKQMMWSFNGEVPGPILRGKVGDTFEVTLVNDGKAGHSIDFHASQTPMDVDMRTIQPGESLVYRFRATRSGMWMYHCGTAPVLHHIGNGMYGAVVIDPPDLALVDREYAFVQSEIYAGTSTDVASLDDMLAERWGAVVLNGYANQYEVRPIITAKPGERVRIWVLDAGPSENTAFHIVGAQWHTVFKEGAYLLRPDNPERGGSQTLDLQPSQGGFVELTFPADGTYAMVTHKFASASKGALGLWKVGDVPDGPAAGH
jgi:nitrite reductase (NO-forming)